MSNIPESGFVFIRDEVIAAASYVPERATYILTSTTLYTSIQSLGNGESFTSADGRKWYIIEGFGGAGDPTKSVLSVVGEVGHVNATQMWNGLSETPDANLPARLRTTAQRTTNWNTTRDAGFYYSDWVTGLPDGVTGSYTGMVLRHIDGHTQQFIYQQNSGKMWRRSGSTNGLTWNSWKEVIDTETDIAAKMNPRYAYKSHTHDMSDINGLIDALAANKTTWAELGEIPEANMRARLQEYGQLVSNWNDATTSGFFNSANATALNQPSNELYSGMVIARHSAWLTQWCWAVTSDSAADTKTYRRERNNGSWTPWVKTLETITELDARYAKSVHGHAITDITGLREELDSLTAGGGTGGNMEGRAYPRLSTGANLNFTWTATAGTPAQVWGGSSANDVRIYNPMNWGINTATQAALDTKDATMTVIGAGQYVNSVEETNQRLVLQDYTVTDKVFRLSWGSVKTWIRSWIGKGDVGLNNVDNTSDLAKPISTATQTALNTKPLQYHTPEIGFASNNKEYPYFRHTDNSYINLGTRAQVDGKVSKAGDTMTGTLTGRNVSGATSSFAANGQGGSFAGMGTRGAPLAMSVSQDGSAYAPAVKMKYIHNGAYGGTYSIGVLNDSAATAGRFVITHINDDGNTQREWLFNPANGEMQSSGIYRYNGQNIHSIGNGQWWQDMTPHRAKDTNYVNNTGRPIMAVIYQDKSYGTYATIVVNEFMVARAYNWHTDGRISGVSIIIPVGATYRYGWEGSGGQAIRELRD